MNGGSRTFALLLAMTPGLGARSVTRILARNAALERSPEQFLALSAETLSEEYRLTKKAVHWLTAGRQSLISTTAELEKRLEGLGVRLVTSADAAYPTIIEEFDPDPPGVLFFHGNFRLLETQTFAVLSSRGSMPADLDWIERLAEEGVLRSETIVSGHDTAEYQRASVVPLRYGSPRILVLDRGLFTVLGEELNQEAFRTARLWRTEFDPRTDLAVSPFRPESEFFGVNNQIRDRLVASLSRRLDVVRANPGGNMERLMRLALKAGRPVRLTDRSLNPRSFVDLGATILST